MIAEFLARLSGATEPDPLPEPDARLALGALLVRVAKSDQAYLAEEIGVIDRLLAAHYDLNPVEAAKMRATCEKLEAEAPETETFAALIREAVPYGDRLAVYAALWKVTMADGIKRAEEVDVLKAAQTSLALAPGDCQNIEAGGGEPPV